MRIITINEEEVLHDNRAASKIIMNAIQHAKNTIQVTGCCKHNNNIVVILEAKTHEDNCTYLFAPISAQSDADLITSLRSRYDSGFTTITKFDIAGLSWALFSQPIQ